MLSRISRRSFLALGAAPLLAQAELPSNATIVVPYPPGSAPDLLARTLAQKMTEITKKVVVVENRPGANAILGSSYVSKARPDGSVLLLVDRMTIVANPLLYKSLPYDPKALEGISDVAEVSLFLTVRSDAPYKDWPEFVSYAKANPGAVSIGSGGNGSVHHISLELMSKATGARFMHVPYKGIVPAVQDVLGGQISGVISGAEVIQPHLPSGKLRVLAVGAPVRSPLFPDVPTLKELGVQTPVLLPTTFSLFAPPGMAPSLRDEINASVRSAMSDPEVAKRLRVSNLVPHPSAPEEIKRQLDLQAPQLAAVIKEADIHLE